MLPTATLYTRPGCHLCEEAEALLQQLASRYPHHLELVNIDEDATVRARYHLTIPVIRIGEVELEAPIEAPTLEATLRAAGQA